MLTPPLPAQVRIVRCRSIHEVDEAVWDSINSDEDVFHSHRFIRSVEDARVENSHFWYLLFYRGEDLVATAALSAFTVSLDLFIGGGPARLIQGLRRWWPRLLKIDILVCGLPVSLGQHHLVIRDAAQSGEILARLVQEMSEICRVQQIRYMCVKEFLESQIGAVCGIEDHGFFRANSIPYVTLNLSWSSFEAYLASLRHGYRRPIKLTLKKLGQTAPIIETSKSSPSSPGNPRLVLGGSEVCSPDKFYELYLQVMERAEVKLETLNKSFFENLYIQMNEDWKVLAFVKEEEILGSALLVTSSKTMTFVLVGLDYAKRDEYDVYFNLVYGIVYLAICQGYRQLHLGQTSYWLKQRIGGECIPEYFYFKANHRLIHFLIRSLRQLLFPVMKLQKPQPFREPLGRAEGAGDQDIGRSLEINRKDPS